MDKFLYGFLAILLAGLGWNFYSEKTFDYSVCAATDKYEKRWKPAWVQVIPGSCVGNPPICRPTQTIYHPELRWTERLYICPGKEYGSNFNKWRIEGNNDPETS